MIQIETANNYKNSDLLSLKNSFDIGLKPLSYTPHINALIVSLFNLRNNAKLIWKKKLINNKLIARVILMNNVSIWL